jgi:hypothetical protein
VTAKRTSEIILVRTFSAQPETTWREVVSDKTAALDARMRGTDERLASVQKAMEVNKEAIDKAVGATEKGIKDAVGCIKADVGGIKTDMEKAVGGIKADVGGIKTDMKDALKQEFSAMEKVLKAELSAVKDSVKSEVSSVKDSFNGIERLFYLAIAVFIFGKPELGGIKDVIDAAKEGVASKKERA